MAYKMPLVGASTASVQSEDRSGKSRRSIWTITAIRYSEETNAWRAQEERLLYPPSAINRQIRRKNSNLKHCVRRIYCVSVLEDFVELLCSRTDRSYSVNTAFQVTMGQTLCCKDSVNTVIQNTVFNTVNHPANTRKNCAMSVRRRK